MRKRTVLLLGLIAFVFCADAVFVYDIVEDN